MQSHYPTIRQIKSMLRNNTVVQVRRQLTAAHVVGSVAKGTATAASDLDIAVVIQPVRGKTSLQLTEDYHGRFTDNRFKPQWNGRTVDFQFFYPEDSELEGYAKITLLP